MDWFYAVKDERKGPVTDRELTALISSGQITRDTLVWNQTMTDWKSAGSTPLFSASTQQPPEVPIPPDHHLCIVTGKPFHVSQMLKTEHGWVSVEGKDLYYQSLREGAAIPLADGQSNARADGKKIVIPVFGGKLPQRCVKTNQPVTETELKTKTLYWCTPAIYFALLANILIVLILNYVLRKKVILAIPLSREGKAVVFKNRMIALGIFLAGLGLMILGGFLLSNDPGSAFPLIIVLGLLVMLGSLVYTGRKGGLLRIVKIKDGNAWLTGASKEFVASLPAYR